MIQRKVGLLVIVAGIHLLSLAHLRIGLIGLIVIAALVGAVGLWRDASDMGRSAANAFGESRRAYGGSCRARRAS